MDKMMRDSKSAQVLVDVGTKATRILNAQLITTVQTGDCQLANSTQDAYFPKPVKSMEHGTAKMFYSTALTRLTGVH